MSECQRCGLCCMECGDMYTHQPGYIICPWLKLEGNVAICRVEDDKPKTCRDYPVYDIDGGKCKRELLNRRFSNAGLQDR